MTSEADAAADPGADAEIDVSDAAAVARWAAALGTTDEALQHAVQAVGRRLDKLKNYLGAGANAGEQSGG